MIKIVGLGAESGDISLNALETLKNSDKIILRSGETQSKEYLIKSGFKFETLDRIYELCKDFDELNEKLAQAVELIHSEYGNVCYAVDGDGIADNSVKILAERNRVEIIPGVSRVSGSLAAVMEQSVTGGLGNSIRSMSLYDVLADKSFLTDSRSTVVITDLDNAISVGELKLRLFDFYDEEKQVCMVSSKGFVKIKLYEIDRQENYDYSTVLVLENEELTNKKRFAIADLIEIMRILRGDNGCEWDKAQNHESIKTNLIEEAYELFEAIELMDDEKMREETGDVLLQVIFHSEMSDERGAFTFTDVLSGLCQKLIFRHSHIFGSDKAKTAGDALSVWDKNKTKEKGFKNIKEEMLAVPKQFPALMRAEKIMKKAEKAGLKLAPSELSNIILSLSRNLTTVKEIKSIQEDSYGELMLALCSLALALDIDAEATLKTAVDKFIENFEIR